MCDAQTEAAVKDMVNELTGDSQMFTAFDVTKAVRANGLRVKHNDVRGVVHAMYNCYEMDSDYQRTSHTLPNGESAFVFHDMHDDLNYYDSDAIKGPAAKAAPVAKPAPKVVAPVSNAVATGLKYSMSPDGRNRICVPAKALRAIGLRDGDEVGVFVERNSIRLGHFAMPDATYYVDKSGNVRLTSSLLFKASLFNKNVDGGINGKEIVLS